MMQPEQVEKIIADGLPCEASAGRGVMAIISKR
jgi:hypothetical protein